MNVKYLTIIIPVYNTEKYIERCLESVCLIKHEIDVIIVDDGSTDNSGKLCDYYEKIDSRIKVIHQKNAGHTRAREKGIKNVATDYFTFVDSDDFVDFVLFDNMLNCLFENECQDADVICTGMIEEYLSKSIYKRNLYSSGIYEGEDILQIYEGMLSKGNFFNFGILPNLVCKIFNTNFVKNNPTRVNECIKVGEDADMTYQLLLRAKKIQISDIAPYHYCRRNDSIMGTKILPETINYLKQDLESAFKQYSNMNRILLSQLNDYIEFLHLLYNPNKLLEDNPFFKDSNDRIALYGAGGVGKALKNGMRSNFTLWVDKNCELYNSDEIKSVDKLVTEYHSYDKIFIAISDSDTCESIKGMLIKKGIDKPIYYYKCEDLYNQY